MAKRYDNLSIKYDWIYRITAKQKAEYLPIDKANLFDVAKDKGYMTFVVGNYLPYCEMFKDYLDVCRSFSEYNYGGVNKDFSILNPIMTVFNIWPRQKPQGLIKNIGASLLQKKRIEETRDFVFEAFKQIDAFFLFAHIYLPHIPFVFNRQGFYWNKEPFLQNDENYRNQLDYCDEILGQFLEKLKEAGKFDSSKIIVLSDHNYRLKFPGRENHIPMFIKRPYQKTRKDIYEEVHAEKMLKREIGD